MRKTGTYSCAESRAVDIDDLTIEFAPHQAPLAEAIYDRYPQASKTVFHTPAEINAAGFIEIFGGASDFSDAEPFVEYL